MPARVSLCTITRNRPRLLELLGACILKQDYPLALLEWVIVDDSDTGLEPELGAVLNSPICVRHVRTAHRLPIGAKRNLCHEHASTDLMVVLDDDDYYPPSRVADAIDALEKEGALVAGCDRLPLLLLPDGRAWLTPAFGAGHATANTLAYQRAYLDLGHQFDPEAREAEEASFLNQFRSPLRQLNPHRTVTWIGHGTNTVDKRLWIARIGEQRFEKLETSGPGWPPQDFIRDYCKALGLGMPNGSIGEESNPRSDIRKEWRIAVVTPYHNESLGLLKRCHDSVLAQDLACTHVLVADGVGAAELDGWCCRHIRLGAGHDDNGNTPRAIGALAAMNEGFNCIAFLDADNWFTPDHLSRSIATQAATGCSVVFSDRHIVFPNGQRLTEQPVEDRERRHADTSCMVLFAPAFSSLALWAQMPRLLAPQCDRVMFSHLMATQDCAWSKSATVYFETWYANHFLAAGLLPPLNAKFLAKYPEAAWKEAAEAFRQRSPTPIYPGKKGIGSEKPRIQLVSVLGPHRSGGTLLQHMLCKHLGFQGIPEHQAFHHLVIRAGPDHQVRHSAQQIQEWLSEGSPEVRQLKPLDREGLALQGLWNQDRSYTLLEAYFRVVLAQLPASSMAFAKAYGQVTVLDRSCSHALVADVLFRCLPEHRAVLVIRDPIDQIQSVLRMQAHNPKEWGALEAPNNLEHLCRSYLRSVATPLTSAPKGQLNLVFFEHLQKDINAVAERTCRFLGLEPNVLMAIESIDLPEDHTTNMAHNEAYTRQVGALQLQLLRNDEPWKQCCLEVTPDQGEVNEHHSSCAELPAWLTDLMAPIQQAVKELTGLSRPKVGPVMNVSQQPPSASDELRGHVEAIVSGLHRHSSCCNEGEE